MTDKEYDILDELYFVTPFSLLADETGLDKSVLKSNLNNLVNKGFVRVYVSMDEEANEADLDMEKNFNKYYYLASKKGLFEHNSR